MVLSAGFVSVMIFPVLMAPTPFFMPFVLLFAVVMVNSVVMVYSVVMVFVIACTGILLSVMVFAVLFFVSHCCSPCSPDDFIV